MTRIVVSGMLPSQLDQRGSSQQLDTAEEPKRAAALNCYFFREPFLRSTPLMRPEFAEA